MLPFKPLLLLLIVAAATLCPIQQAQAQTGIVEAVKAATKKVIKAVDLMVQRLQNGVLDAQNIQKGIENELSRLRLKDIADWTLKQKELYKDYFDELWKVKQALSYYHRFTEIASLQKQIVSEYQIGFSLARQDKMFTEQEIQFIYRVYTGMINESINGLDDILTLMTSFTVQMSDEERIAIIDKTTVRLENLLTDLRVFTRGNQNLSVQRQTVLTEMERLKIIYGL